MKKWNIIVSLSSSSSSSQEFQLKLSTKNVSLVKRHRCNRYSSFGVPTGISTTETQSNADSDSSNEISQENTQHYELISLPPSSPIPDDSYLQRKIEHDERYRISQEPFKRYKLLIQEVIDSPDNDIKSEMSRLRITRLLKKYLFFMYTNFFYHN